MDALNHQTLQALEHIICVAEDLPNVAIKQDTEKECLIITDYTCDRETTINCACNSVGATIRQICSHINKCDLFSYDPNYTIGM